MKAKKESHFYAESESLSIVAKKLADWPLRRRIGKSDFAFLIWRPEKTGGAIGAGYREESLWYPCSLAKVFYLAAAQSRLADGFGAPKDLPRAMSDMIVWSSNAAANYVLDWICGTTGDTSLSPMAFREWAKKREAVNRFFDSLGWPEWRDCNLCQKMTDEDRYGRESKFLYSGKNHNRLSPLAMGRIMRELFCGRLVTAARDSQMRKKFRRDFCHPFANRPEYQLRGYLGESAPRDCKYFSKAGHNFRTGDPAASWFRHDSCYLQAADGKSLGIVLFTRTQRLAEDDSFMPEFMHRTLDLIL